jgi:hypothetical protein
MFWGSRYRWSNSYYLGRSRLDIISIFWLPVLDCFRYVRTPGGPSTVVSHPIQLGSSFSQIFYRHIQTGHHLS